MDAVLRVFKHVCGLSPIEGGTVLATAMTSYCSMRLLVASSQAIHLIGKHGSTIKSIKEKSGASLQVLSGVDSVVLHVLRCLMHLYIPIY